VVWLPTGTPTRAFPRGQFSKRLTIPCYPPERLGGVQATVARPTPNHRSHTMTNPPAMQSIPLPDGAIAWTRDGVDWYRLEPHPSGGVRITRMDAPTKENP
jgi:hypothetical protein